MTDHVTTRCPDCEAVLVTAGLARMQTIRCAGCEATFLLGFSGQTIRTSRKAQTSLILGLSSLFCMLLSGIPAVILGMLALRDIRRRPGALMGRGFALAGIISGTVLGVGTTCFAIVAAALSTWMANSFERSTEPGRVREIAATMAEFDLPPGIKPRSAVQLIGMTAVVFVDAGEQGADRLKIHLVHYTNWMLRDRRQVRAQLVYHKDQLRGSHTESSHQWTCHVGGEAVQVTEEVRSDESGPVYRNYIAVLPARDGNVLAIVVAKEPQTTGTEPRLTTDMVRQFFESFTVPE